MKFIAGFFALIATIAIGAAVAAASRKRDIVPLEDEDANEVRLVAIFSPVAFHSTATAFRGGTLDCWYGGGIVDLRDATLDLSGRPPRGQGGLRRRPDHRPARLAGRDERERRRRRPGCPAVARPSRDRATAHDLQLRAVRRDWRLVGRPQEALKSVRAEMLKQRKSEAGSSDVTDGVGAIDAPADAPIEAPAST